MAHTPTPWKFEELRGNDGLGYIRPADDDYKEIAHHGDTERPPEENRDNAHLIVRAVNAFQPLVEALERAEIDLRQLGYPVQADRCKAALKLGKDGTENG